MASRKRIADSATSKGKTTATTGGKDLPTNQQLQTQVVALQNNSTQTEDDLESNRSPSLHALNELIQKHIVEAKLP